MGKYLLFRELRNGIGLRCRQEQLAGLLNLLKSAATIDAQKDTTGGTNLKAADSGPWSLSPLKQNSSLTPGKFLLLLAHTPNRFPV
jgi:hypothetical protein